jgi:hypothetical protein
MADQHTDHGVLLNCSESIGPYCAVQTNQGCTSSVEGWRRAYLTTYPAGSDAVVPDVTGGSTPSASVGRRLVCGRTFRLP